MSHMLELPDDIYTALLRTAESAGTTPVELLRRQLALSPPSPAAPAFPQAGEERVPPELVSLLKEIAPIRGVTLEELAARWRKEPSVAFHNRDRDSSGAAASSFDQKHGGIYASDNPDSGDNDQIEADLAREFGRDMERV